jgi:putative copper resistance protein D
MPEGFLKYLMYGDAVAVQCGLALMVGGLASMLWLRRGASSWAQGVVRLSRRSFIVGVVAAFVASAAALWFQAAAMGDGALASAGSMVPMMVVETHYGHAWSMGIIALLISGLSMATLRRFSVLLAALGSAAFMLTRSVVSHAGVDGDLTLKVATDWVHLVLVCLWAGMVLLGAFVALLQAPKNRVDAADFAVWVSSLSTAATVALVCILLTGALKVWWATPSLGLLISSAYGGVLLVKLLLVGAAIGLGGINRFFVMPRLLTGLRGAGQPASGLHRQFVRVLRIEALVLLLAFVAAAVLSGTAAPGES